MSSFFLDAAFAASLVVAYTVVLTMVLISLPRLGGPGSKSLALLCRAPGLDVLVSLLTWVPWVAGAWLAGPAGFVGVLVGQSAGLTAWVMIHELIHRKAVRGPRIVKTLNKIVGRWRNHVALWVSLLAIPLFLMLRFGEIVIYPFFRLLLGFPRIRHAEWITVSRHKFDGLVGHDLIWCLYCDWMTGIYSLGAEMLRVVESFWCPIRFGDHTKCEKCRIDFPDVDLWTPADGSMSDVVTLVEDSYGDGQRHWLGHPVRLSVSARKKDQEGTEHDEKGDAS